MTAIEDLCDRCAKNKAHFEIELIKTLPRGDTLEVDDRPFPRAGYLCRPCEKLLQDNFPGFYGRKELTNL